MTTSADATLSVPGPQGALTLRVDRDAGSGVPLLLLHADAGRLEQWGEVAAALPEVGVQGPLARLDFRGHGSSAPAADDDYSHRGRAEDVVAVLDHLGWSRALLVAHSGGNGAALHLASVHPDRVAGILMVDPPTDPAGIPEEAREQMIDGLAGPDSLAFLGDYYRSIAGGDAAVVERVLADTTATTPQSRLGVGEALMRWDPQQVELYTGPTFVIGTDVTDGPSALWRQLPDLPHRVVPDTGHWVNIERPDEVAEQVTRLLAGIG